MPDDGAAANDLLLTVRTNTVARVCNGRTVWDGILSDGVPLAITGRDGATDRLTVELHGTNLLAGGVTFHAGTGAGDPDSLTLVGGAEAPPALTPAGTGAGRYDYPGGGRISYTGVETVRDAQPPQVLAGEVAVNGAAAQRSLLTELALAFDRAVVLAAGAFTLTRPADGTPVTDGGAGPHVLVADTTTADGRTVAVLTFQTAAGSDLVEGRGGRPATLAAGVWVLRGDAAKVSAGGVPMVADFFTPAAGAGRVHRLFGDLNADGATDPADLFQFRRRYNAPLP